jgi:predicted transcriptional regulator
LKLQAARSTFEGVSIELSRSVEEQLRNLAARQGRDISALVEDAVRQYLEAAAITDVEPSEVAEAQAALLGELPDVPVWKADRA